MGKIVSVVNQKGGVGKTTTVINLATSLAAIDQKVLLIDLDPQGNASTGCGVDNANRQKNIYHLLVSDQDNENIKDFIQESIIENLDIIPSTIDLAAAEVELFYSTTKHFTLFNKVINKVKDEYDFIFIDCPPSLGMLTVNGMCAANSILIPMQCEFFAMEGLSHLMKTYQFIKNNFNHNIDIEGILLTMYDPRNKLTQQVETEIRNFSSSKVYKTTIPRNVRISEAPSHGKPVLVYDINCAGSIAYINLAKEVIERNLVRIG